MPEQEAHPDASYDEYHTKANEKTYNPLAKYKVEKITETPDDGASKGDPKPEVHRLSGVLILNYSTRNRLLHAPVVLRVVRTKPGVGHLHVGEDVLTKDDVPVEQDNANGRDHGSKARKPREVPKANAGDNANNGKASGRTDHNLIVSENLSHDTFA